MLKNIHSNSRGHPPVIEGVSPKNSKTPNAREKVWLTELARLMVKHGKVPNKLLWTVRDVD